MPGPSYTVVLDWLKIVQVVPNDTRLEHCLTFPEGNYPLTVLRLLCHRLHHPQLATAIWLLASAWLLVSRTEAHAAVVVLQRPRLPRLQHSPKTAPSSTKHVLLGPIYLALHVLMKMQVAALS